METRKGSMRQQPIQNVFRYFNYVSYLCHEGSLFKQLIKYRISTELLKKIYNNAKSVPVFIPQYRCKGIKIHVRLIVLLPNDTFHKYLNASKNTKLYTSYTCTPQHQKFKKMNIFPVTYSSYDKMSV